MTTSFAAKYGLLASEDGRRLFLVQNLRAPKARFYDVAEDTWDDTGDFVAPVQQ